MFASARSGRFVAILMVIAAVAGCASSPRLPDDARLIWSGEVDKGGHVWKDIQPMRAGQVYAVDHETGRVEGVDSVWEGKPKFSFELRPHRRYDLYFVQQAQPATRPVQ